MGSGKIQQIGTQLSLVSKVETPLSKFESSQGPGSVTFQIGKLARMTLFNYIFLSILLFATCSLDVLAQDGPRRGRRGDGEQRQFDVGALMARLDANKNGILDANELNDRTRDFLRRMGMEDLGESIPVADVIKKFEERNSGRQSPSQNESARRSSNDVESSIASVRKLPGFDTPIASATPLPKFLGVASTAPGVKAYEQYSDSVKTEVDNTLRRYDTNNDGVIDAEEMKEMRWRAPSAAEADLNGDGILNREEIAHRYAQRESANSQNSGGSSGRDTNRGGDRGNASDRGNNSGTSGRNDSSRNDSRGEERPASTSSNASTNGNNSRSSSSSGIDYRRYAQEMFDKYDENKDGVLDKDEFSKLRRKPPNADSDNDGNVTLQELVAAYEEMERSGATSSTNNISSSAPASGGDNNRTERNSRASISTRGSSRPTPGGGDSGSFSIARYDKNNDGQVQMWEFADEWTAETLAEFRKWDKNNDGVITADEVRSR
jgi:Ca2+-binding EF-hand superfamily protein